MLYLAENKHFWHRARREYIYQRIKPIFLKFYNESYKDISILDVGAGTGSITREFLQEGFNNIALGEIHSQGLEYAKTYGITKLYCMDLLDVPFENEFDCIFAFDVIEHIEDDKQAIMNMKHMLKDSPKSLLCLSVPAHKWLWNAHDVIVHHKRRYTKTGLVRLLQECGFKIHYAQYFFVAITPLLYMRSLLNPASKITIAKEELRDTPPPALLNNMLFGICRLENMILKILPHFLNPPFGGSLFVVANRA